MRIVYRGAPEHFRILRTVDHLHPDHAALNKAYEMWEESYLADYRPKGPAKSATQRDVTERKRFYMR